MFDSMHDPTIESVRLHNHHIGDIDIIGGSNAAA